MYISLKNNETIFIKNVLYTSFNKKFKMIEFKNKNGMVLASFKIEDISGYYLNQ